MSLVNDVIDYLSQRKTSIACAGKNGLQVFMRDLGFDDTEGDTPGHRVFTHVKLNEMADFTTTSIDCGHKPRREMKPCYVLKILKVLRKYQSQLEQIEDDKNA